MGTWLVDTPQRLTLEDPVRQLDVWLLHGKLHVVGTDGPARVEVRTVGRKGLTITQQNGLLSVRHDTEKGMWSFGGIVAWAGWKGRYTADVIVAVPPGTTASLTLASGDAVVSGLREGVSVDVASGSIALMGIGGVVRAKTVSGSIEAVGVSGDLSMETVSGEISLADSAADRVHARTISGGVTCDLGNPFARDVHLTTVSGSITIRVPEDADLSVSLGAASGSVTSSFPQLSGPSGGRARSASGRLGTGSGTLRAYAVSGSVSLLAAPAVGDADLAADGPTDGGGVANRGERADGGGAAAA